MDSNSIILLLCGLVIISYLFEIFSKKTGIPSVLFLITLGILLNKLTVFYEIPAVDFLRLIPVIGTVGLILIVFEGSLEIEYHSDKKKILFKVLAVSIIILAANSVIMAIIFQHFTGLGFHQCFVNAIPLSVISSAIAIPSAAHLSSENREFITMESSLSDILGIILFNYAIINSTLTFFLTGKIIIEIIVVTIVSFIFCLILLYLLRTIGHNIKFVLILSVMVFLYSLGKSIHVSSGGFSCKNFFLYHIRFYFNTRIFTLPGEYYNSIRNSRSYLWSSNHHSSDCKTKCLPWNFLCSQGTHNNSALRQHPRGPADG
ncbi:MAG: hypothetical protein CVV49_01505 [Spirochaetae bacterium HGW-Spirochaetae-5]|nr:MAG: hypothetical protein CVV49_01505 [Spirochaetae bacterium HGW-Spirochaetae-5]